MRKELCKRYLDLREMNNKRVEKIAE